MLPLHASVAELEGLDVPSGAYGMGSLAWLSRALVSPLGQLGPADLRLLLGHGRGLRWLLPVALERLEREPFAGGDHGPGELLTAALAVDPAAWAADPSWLPRLAAVVATARAQVHVLPERVRGRVAGDLEAVRELFGF
ncbi:contact-dependent growth inhibition system immunity protein [Roseisolibacter sp. H3M3-2]|uniref:contact-dependent growth inhibition system immunity protein n=1 Tax=Roseisolibacter sp. H3M3-2 TaxID=3031323 RepID=UPI0023DB41D0|nr:contact-dependent growth inhibition system immunity protein [Roseisolibacter sp. H3M3-2]MDF1502897.1 contact-dependent growth inhibition system immunity protein [Roseisolibacter sp. H3M3-2]